jgi:hypothetical protein
MPYFVYLKFLNTFGNNGIIHKGAFLVQPFHYGSGRHAKKLGNKAVGSLSKAIQNNCKRSLYRGFFFCPQITFNKIAPA